MALTKIEKNLARDLWMRLYKAGTPIEARHVVPGTLVVVHETDAMSDASNEYNDYYAAVIVGANKNTLRCAVETGTYPKWEHGTPMSQNQLVVALQPFVLSADDSLVED